MRTPRVESCKKVADQAKIPLKKKSAEAALKTLMSFWKFIQPMKRDWQSARTLISLPRCMKERFNPIDSVIADLQKGKMVIVVDDADRENEGNGHWPPNSSRPWQ